MLRGQPGAMLPFEIGLVSRPEQLTGILDLQRENLEPALSRADAASQGFVTVVHSRHVLERLHALAPSVIACAGPRVVGYALVMLREARHDVPLLEPLFQLLEGVHFRGVPLAQRRYYLMGQVCVAREYRGRGVFDALYAAHRQHYAEQFDCSVTEVATRNLRSLRAHARVGFETIERYRDAQEEWAVLAWAW
ncbi:MAG TPA: GNAT family N-acetyltransferase [Polyangiaceae bacterium]|nr:GNAT family N-acetyltransferase [Polyangiaceae bacterium]